MIVGALLRGYGLNDRALWFDEAFSWRMASFSPFEVIGRSAADNNPPLYYLALKLWMALLGESTVALRLLSALAGLATCLGSYLLGAETYRETARSKGDNATHLAHWIGVCAAAFVAASTFQNRWAWEARMYTLGAALAVSSSWLLLRALHSSEESLVRWLLYAATALAFLYTHTFAVFSVGAQALFIVAQMCVCGSPQRGKPPSYRRPILALAMIAAGWAPWLVALKNQTERVQHSFWSAPLDRWHLPHYCYQMMVEPEDPRLDRTFSIIAAGTSALVLLQLLWRPREGDWLIFLMAVVPVAGGVLVSLAGTNIVHPRYLFFAQTFLLIAFARLLGRIPGVFDRTAVAGIVVGNMLFVHYAFVQRLEIYDRPGARGAAQYIGENRHPQVPVIVASPFYFTPMLFHLADRSNCYLFDGGKGFVHYQGTAALKPDDFIDAKRLQSLETRHVWAVNNKSGGAWGVSKVDVPADWIELRRQSFREVYGVQGSVEAVQYGVPQHGDAGK